MGKRSEFERVPRDFYPTPLAAVIPLIKNIEKVDYYEPCVGKLDLVKHLAESNIECLGFSDIHNQYDDVAAYAELDATTYQYNLPKKAVFITNPPWDRVILHRIIENLSNQAPTWLLFDSDWLFTKQATPFLPRLRKIIVIGRVKWIPDSKFTGKDNCCWYLFDKPSNNNTIEFLGKGINV